MNDTTPSPADVDQKRLRELLRLEAVTEIKREVTKWALGALTIIIALASVGLLAYFPSYVDTIVTKHVEIVAKDKIDPEIKRGRAVTDELLKTSGALLENSRQTVKTAETTLQNVDKTAKATLESIKNEVAEERKLIAGRAHELDRRLKLLDATMKEIEDKRSYMERRQAALDRQIERSQKDINRNINALVLRFSEIEIAATPDKRIVQALQDKVSSGEDWVKKSAAVSALAQYGREAEAALPELREILREFGDVVLESSELQFMTAVSIAIVKIGGEGEAEFLVNLLMDEKTRYTKMVAITEGLRSISPVTSKLVDLIEMAFSSAEDDSILSSQILEVLDRGSKLQVEPPNTRFRVRDLFVSALKRRHTIQSAAYALADDFPDIGNVALPYLKELEKDQSLGPIVLEALSRAVLAIEKAEVAPQNRTGR